MAGKHSADDDFNPYRHQSNRQMKKVLKEILQQEILRRIM